MSQQTTFLSRIGKFFRRDQFTADNGDTPETTTTSVIEPRATFLRPWAKRDAAISHLQEGFVTLTDLMTAIRDNLERQNRRNDELHDALQQLPQVLQTLPESSRVQSETLVAIRRQMEGQSVSQERLSVILEKIGANTAEHRQMVDALRGRVEDLHKADTSIADHMSTVGAALQDVSKNSQTSAQVLEQMRDNVDARDGQLERVLHRQGTRFTTMLAVAIFLSIAALAAVGVLAYLILNQKHPVL